MMNEPSDEEWSPAQSNLKLKHRKVEETIENPPLPPQNVRKKKAKKPGHESGRFASRFLSRSIGSFLFGILLFGAFLYHQVNELGILTDQQAAMTRGMTVAVFFVILVIEAFRVDILQGILSFFLPPYAFVFGLLFADAGPVRGLTMALLVFLGAEVYFTPEDALVPKTMTAINEFIESGQQKLINPDKEDAGFVE